MQLYLQQGTNIKVLKIFTKTIGHYLQNRK